MALTQELVLLEVHSGPKKAEPELTLPWFVAKKMAG